MSTVKNLSASLVLSRVYGLLWEWMCTYYPEDQLETGATREAASVEQDLAKEMSRLSVAGLDAKEIAQVNEDHEKVLAFVNAISETPFERRPAARSDYAELRSYLRDQLLKHSGAI